MAQAQAQDRWMGCDT